jgi:hypothetical protein
MATGGENSWPPAGRSHVHLRGGLMSTYGENEMAIDKKVAPPAYMTRGRERHWLGRRGDVEGKSH